MIQALKPSIERQSPVASKPAGFSLIELLVSMSITMLILGVAVATFSAALGRREREASPAALVHVRPHAWARLRARPPRDAAQGRDVECRPLP